ncbi:FAD-dependent oxidoreductase [Nocardia sp. NPDC057668]|uniref:FAD-dependent oxidoreductase n=1 Tax=Nocardia sp. NPDC057668 TaxID=3346202 RepID=UPI0036712772
MTAGEPLIEIREFGRPARRRQLAGPLIFGRGGNSEILSDSEVSRQHLRLVPTPTALSVVDLGSRNGTTVNGVTLSGRHVLAVGDVVRLGRTEIIVLRAPDPGAPPEIGVDTHVPAAGHVVPPPPGERRVSTAVALAERILDIDATGTRNMFPTFPEMPARLPLRAWQVARAISVTAYLALVLTLFLDPTTGLLLFFGVLVPLLPGLFLLAPGLWRNTCPLAAINQAPRLFGIGRAATAPRWIQRYGYLVAVALFFGIAGSRLAGLDRSGVATGCVLLAVAVAAGSGGLAFKGKSGWCSSICPLFPVQRAYGQTPFVTVPNNHCEPCVGCAKNCFDFTPRAAYQADLDDPDPAWSSARKLFAAALPGFVLGFFILAGSSGLRVAQRYELLALFLLAAVGVFFVLESTTAVGVRMLAAGYAAAALNFFYWFAGPVLFAALGTLTGVSAPWLRWPLSLLVLVASLLFLARTRVSELQYARATGDRDEPVLLPFPRPRAAAESLTAAAASVVFEPGGGRVEADAGMSLLDCAERANLPLEAGCRMGVCGADPVAVLAGAESLGPAGGEERNTLRRLGFAENTRMACAARVRGGEVRVSLTPQPGSGNGSTTAHFDRSIVSVVIVGNGIAGVTAADFIRRGHPDCEIHLVGRESHDFYNRMGISRLVYGRSAMQGLHLLPEQWYADHQVTAWLNTLAARLDTRAQRVHLGTGDVLPYDRLVLAMGASAAAPPIEGLHRPGSFVLREAADALRIRAYAQRHGSARALVAGGGLLGLEAAYALHQLGLRVTVLERGARLLGKQLDSRCSELVLAHFTRLGIDVARGAETARLLGEPGVRAAVLTDGRTLPCDLFLAATGIRPNIELARRAGLPVSRGILVDDRMRTAAPHVYAAGDVAEHRDRVPGLWPIAAEQAQAAAVNALGGNQILTAELPATLLKGVGLELFAIGRTTPAPGDELIVAENPAAPSYRSLTLSLGRCVGATILGHHPADVAAAESAVRARAPFPPHLRNSLRAGDWTPLSSIAPA